MPFVNAAVDLPLSQSGELFKRRHNDRGYIQLLNLESHFGALHSEAVVRSWLFR